MVTACEQKAYPISHVGIKYDKKAICHAKPDEVRARSRSQTKVRAYRKGRGKRQDHNMENKTVV